MTLLDLIYDWEEQERIFNVKFEGEELTDYSILSEIEIVKQYEKDEHNMDSIMGWSTRQCMDAVWKGKSVDVLVEQNCKCDFLGIALAVK